jgi:hypothetical protein
VSSRALTLAGFGAILVAGAVWAVASACHPRGTSLAEVWNALVARRVVRVVLVGGWAWLGWHLFARGSGAFD